VQFCCLSGWGRRTEHALSPPMPNMRPPLRTWSTITWYRGSKMFSGQFCPGKTVMDGMNSGSEPSAVSSASLRASQSRGSSGSSSGCAEENVRTRKPPLTIPVTCLPGPGPLRTQNIGVLRRSCSHRRCKVRCIAGTPSCLLLLLVLRAPRPASQPADPGPGARGRGMLAQRGLPGSRGALLCCGRRCAKRQCLGQSTSRQQAVGQLAWHMACSFCCSRQQQLRS
jgi:hypothetical protein